MDGESTAGRARAGDAVVQDPPTIVVRPMSVGVDRLGMVIALLPIMVVYLVAQRFVPTRSPAAR